MFNTHFFIQFGKTPKALYDAYQLEKIHVSIVINIAFKRTGSQRINRLQEKVSMIQQTYLLTFLPDALAFFRDKKCETRVWAWICMYVQAR